MTIVNETQNQPLIDRISPAGEEIVKAIIKHLSLLEEGLSTTKINKLAYYYYAWASVNELDPIFETPQAWTHGPIIPSVYYYVKSLSNNLKNKEWLDSLPDFSNEVLDLVKTSYSGLSKYEISFLSHSELPYMQAIEQHPNETRSINLDPTVIKNYYLSLV